MSQSDPGELAVHYGTLDAAATALGAQAAILEQDIADLKKAILHVAEGWSGEAYNAFQAKSAQWDKHANAIHAALVDIGHKVHAAHGDYHGHDLKAASYFQ
ncbi:WXG100 family type VII secretion target [Streptomyces sp. NPDC047022]|uniref:WXG100 family type VII secretion target n=1 Tax=Streptomyces sp. NPDC047022 TaxID=3155737 RepID=UPI003407AD5B